MVDNFSFTAYNVYDNMLLHIYILSYMSMEVIYVVK